MLHHYGSFHGITNEQCGVKKSKPGVRLKYEKVTDVHRLIQEVVH